MECFEKGRNLFPRLNKLIVLASALVVMNANLLFAHSFYHRIYIFLLIFGRAVYLRILWASWFERISWSPFCVWILVLVNLSMFEIQSFVFFEQFLNEFEFFFF